MLVTNLDGEAVAQLGELAEKVKKLPRAALDVRFRLWCEEYDVAHKRYRVPARRMRQRRARAYVMAQQRCLIAAAEYARRGFPLPDWSPEWLNT